MDAREVVQLPDFAEAADNLHTLANHVRRCANLPAVDGGVQLHAVLQGLQQELAGMRTLITERFDGLDTQLSQLRREAKVERYNSRARQENSTAVRGDARLKALQKLETGEVIAGFPDTVDEALHLSVRDVNRLLRDLDAETEGDLSTKRRRLLFCAGVTQLGVGPSVQ